MTNAHGSEARPPHAPRQEMLALDDAGKVFPDGTVAIEHIDLAVGKGEFVSILGPSGCGKSTILRMASSLERCTSGSVSVATDRLGYVFQDPTLLPWRTVGANVRLFAELHKLEEADAAERTRRALSMVGLETSAEKYPHQLSGGMRMRASLARSLVLEPELFLFDEPFGALDEITREKLNDELLRLYADLSFTALFVTHSISEAVFLSTRVVVLSARPGRIVASVDVPFPYPRTSDLRYDGDFGRLCGGLARTLREQSP